MIDILEIPKLLKKKIISISNKGLNKIVGGYSFYYYNSKLDFTQEENIYQNIKESNIL